MPMAAFFAVFALFLAVPHPAEADVLTEDDVHLALKENATLEQIRSCLGPKNDLSSFEVTLEVGPGGKTEFVSVRPDIPEERLLCVKYAFEKIAFRSTERHYEIKCWVTITASPKDGSQPEAGSLTSYEKKLKRTSTGLIASGILLTSLGGVMSVCGLIFFLSSFQGIFSGPESEDEKARGINSPALIISGVIAFSGGIGLTIAGFVLAYEIKRSEKTAFLPSPGFLIGRNFRKMAFGLAWTF
jgi:hypothetical protein